jgi:hypothetical protein
MIVLLHGLLDSSGLTRRGTGRQGCHVPAPCLADVAAQGDRSQGSLGSLSMAHRRITEALGSGCTKIRCNISCTVCKYLMLET